MTLPPSLAGYQHLALNEPTQPTDILVRHGKPLAFISNCLDFSAVWEYEEHYQANVYRLIPVARQSDAHTGSGAFSTEPPQ